MQVIARDVAKANRAARRHSPQDIGLAAAYECSHDAIAPSMSLLGRLAAAVHSRTTQEQTSRSASTRSVRSSTTAAPPGIASSDSLSSLTFSASSRPLTVNTMAARSVVR